MALKEEYGDRVAFVIVDVQEQEGRELAFQYGIRSIPHTIILDSRGEILLNQAGFKSAENLRGYLDRLAQ